MTMKVADRVFIDTNVMVYAHVAESPRHASALSALKQLYETEIDSCISGQVLREFLVTLTRPKVFTKPPSRQTVVERTRHLTHHFHIREEGHAVTVKLLELMDGFEIAGKQVHDANIVATMLVHGITQVLTHNITDFARFSSLITVLPLTLWEASQNPASES